MQISTSVGVVQDILISLSFQKNTKLIADPSRSQDQPAGICVNCPAAELTARVPERVRPMCLSARSLIDESALIAACSMRQAREATTSISRWPSGDLSMFARISARLTGGHAGNRTYTRPQSATCAERAVRLLSPRLLVVPRSASRCQFIRPRRVVSRHWSLRAA